MKFTFNIEKKYFYFTLGFILIVGVAIFVAAQGVPNPGHDIGEVGCDPDAPNCVLLFSDSRITTTRHIGVSYVSDKLNIARTGVADDLVIDANGRVGIGTTAPETKLHIKGGRLGIQPASWSGDYWNIFHNAADATNDYGLVFRRGIQGDSYLVLGDIANNGASSFPTGNVGIGTTNPTEKLEVAGKVKISGTGGDLGDLTLWHGSFAGVIGTSSNTPLLIYANNQEKIRVLPTGNVGIGTTDPGNDRLRVAGKIQAIGGDICTDLLGGKCLSTSGGIGGSGTINRIAKWDNDNPTTLGDSPLIVSGNDITALGQIDVNGGLSVRGATLTNTGLTLSDEVRYKRIQSWNSEPLLINPQGNNVGVGQDFIPSSKLHVSGGTVTISNSGDEAVLLNLDTERSWEFRQEGAGQSAALKLKSVGGGGNKDFIIDTTGRVGIGKPPGEKLDVNGNVKISGTNSKLILPANSCVIRQQTDVDNYILEATLCQSDEVIVGGGAWCNTGGIKGSKPGRLNDFPGAETKIWSAQCTTTVPGIVVYGICCKFK